MKTTPKARVLKRYPNAYSWKWAGSCPWVIYVDRGQTGGASLNISDRSAALAWKSAWERIRKEPRS